MGTATPLSGISLNAANSTSAGTSLYGSATGTGLTNGVWGAVTGTSGTGVYGTSGATTGTNWGIYGENSSASGIGVFGTNSAAGGTGVRGELSATAGVAGRAVIGVNAATSGASYGVQGQTSSTSTAGAGIFGTSGGTWGVLGTTTAASLRAGVYGGTSNTIAGLPTFITGNAGVYGSTTASGSAGVVGSATSSGLVGVYGSATGGNNYAVRGDVGSNTAVGVYGVNTSVTTTSVGVQGDSAGTTGRGVFGRATSTTGAASGVYGSNASSDAGSSGVFGTSTSTTNNGFAGVWGQIPSTGSNSAYGVRGENLNTTGGVGGWFDTRAASGRAIFANGSVYIENRSGSGSATSGTDALIAQCQNNGAAGINSSAQMFANAFNLTSDRNKKENLQSVDNAEILNKVLALPVTTWNYIGNPSTMRQMGPMAQDFHAAFGLNGNNDTQINQGDMAGVTLAAVQGLNTKLESELAVRDSRLATLESQMNELQVALKAARVQPNLGGIGLGGLIIGVPLLAGLAVSRRRNSKKHGGPRAE